MQAASRLLSYEPNEVPEERRHPLWAFVKRFWGLSAWMLELISFQLLLFFVLFSIGSIRERYRFWASKPSRTLVLAILAGTTVGLLAGAHGFGEMPPLPLTYTALTIGWFGILVLAPNDSLKAWWMGRENADQAIGGAKSRDDFRP